MKKGLGNPAMVTALANNPELIKQASATSNRVINIFLAFGITAVVIVSGVIVYNKFFGFTKIKENKQLNKSNIEQAEAEFRAKQIFQAMYGFGANFKMVETALTGLNFNALARVYNSFGEKRGANFVKQNMKEWIYDQFNATEISALKLITRGFI